MEKKGEHGHAKTALFRSAEILFGSATLIYAASTTDAIIDGDFTAAKTQAIETARFSVITAMTVGSEIYLRKKSNHLGD